MSLYALSDLHLSFGTDKSMEVFRGWEHYTERIEANWRRIIKDDDTIVLAGDTSWGLDTNDCLQDFKFLQNLPGKKILLKGNHDYWWSTMSKLNAFLEENKFDSISFLHNNAFVVEDFAVCGTRGWVYDGTGQQDKKVILRECGRLKMSLEEAKKTGKRPKVFLHYPPVYGEYTCDEILNVLEEYNIEMLYYGHIHGAGENNAPNGFKNIKMRIISCDCVDFTPIFIG